MSRSRGSVERRERKIMEAEKDGRRKVSSDMILGGVLHGYAFCKDCMGGNDLETGQSFDEYEIAGAIPVLEGDIGIELMECASCNCYLES